MSATVSADSVRMTILAFPHNLAKAEELRSWSIGHTPKAFSPASQTRLASLSWRPFSIIGIDKRGTGSRNAHFVAAEIHLSE